MQHVDGGRVHVGPVGLSILSPQLLCNSKAILQFKKKILKIYDYWTHCLRLALHYVSNNKRAWESFTSISLFCPLCRSSHLFYVYVYSKFYVLVYLLLLLFLRFCVLLLLQWVKVCMWRSGDNSETSSLLPLVGSKDWTQVARHAQSTLSTEWPC